MAKKQQSISDKAQYATYKTAGSYAANKAAKIARHMKRHPEDAAAVVASKKVSATPTRKTPSDKVWTPAKRELGQLLRSFGMNGNLALRSLEEREQHLTA